MTGVEILPYDAPRDEWLAARRLGIGASEIAAVMGISPYESPFSLWWKKRNDWGTEPDALMSTGTFLEPTIAAWFAEYGDPNENLTIVEAGLYAHPERPWQLATPDRLLYMVCDGCEGSGWADGPGAGYPFFECAYCTGSGHGSLVGLLECKWAAHSWDGWGEEGTDDVPVHYRAQCLWQLDVMGVDEVLLCALGPGGFRVYRVRRDEKDLVGMRELGRRFMASLEADEPPNVDDHSATLPILRRLHSDIEDREQEITAPVAEGWVRAKRFKDLATKTEKRYAAQLRSELGDAKTAVLIGEKFAIRTTDNKLLLRSSK